VPRTTKKTKEPTHDQIARRAYEISQSGDGGTDEENWTRAERELRREPEPQGPRAKAGSGDAENVTSD
jgi:hypothetical protein